MVELRAESPTLSKVGRHVLLQLAASLKLDLEIGDVTTAFLQGDREAETKRDVYLEPLQELRTKLKLNREQILKLTGSVYGLRTAPRRWYTRVRRDLINLGWCVHQLDQCLFLLYDGDKRLGIGGVYVDDFVLAGDLKKP